MSTNKVCSNNKEAVFAYELSFGRILPSLITFKKASLAKGAEQEVISEDDALRFMKENCGYAAFPAGKPIANFVELNEKLERARNASQKPFDYQATIIMSEIDQFKSVAEMMQIPIDKRAIAQLQTQLIRDYHQLMMNKSSSY